MKKFRVLTRVALYAISFINSVAVLSCTENSKEIAPKINASSRTGMTVNYGWLRFNSKQEFNQTCDLLQTMDDGDLGDWDMNNGIPSINELYSYADNMVLNAESNNSYKSSFTFNNKVFPLLTSDSLISGNHILDMPSSSLSSILNYEGIVQISDSIYRITKDYSYVYSYSQAPDVANGNYQHPILTQANAPSIFDPCNVYWSRQFNQYKDVNGNTLPKGNKNKKTRLAIVVWNVKTILRQEIGQRAKYQRDALIGWVDQDCNAIQIQGGIVFTDSNGAQEGARGDSKKKPNWYDFSSYPGYYPPNLDVQKVEIILAVGWFNFFNVNEYSANGKAIFKGALAERSTSCN